MKVLGPVAAFLTTCCRKEINKMMSDEIFTVLTAENRRNWKIFILINSRDHFLLSNFSGSIWQSDA